MSAPLTLADPVRQIPRYLKPDLSLDEAAIGQAAEAAAHGRVENNLRVRRYLAAHKLSPIKPLDFDTAIRREFDRFEDIAKGMRAAERHARKLDRA